MDSLWKGGKLQNCSTDYDPSDQTLKRTLSSFRMPDTKMVAAVQNVRARFKTEKKLMHSSGLFNNAGQLFWWGKDIKIPPISSGSLCIRYWVFFFILCITITRIPRHGPGPHSARHSTNIEKRQLLPSRAYNLNVRQERTDGQGSIRKPWDSIGQHHRQ